MRQKRKQRVQDATRSVLPIGNIYIKGLPCGSMDYRSVII